MGKRDNLPVTVFLIIILIVNIVLYFNTINYEFLKDDYLLIVENYQIKSFRQFLNSFSTQYFSFPNLQHLHYWRPMVLFSFFIDFKIWGLNPEGFHLTNVLINALNGILIFFIFYFFTRKPFFSFFISIFFSLHPCHISAVSWVSGRTDLLSSFFILLATLFFIVFFKKKQFVFYWLSVITFVPALLSKEGAIFFPLMVAGLILFSGRKKIKEFILLTLPFFILDVIFLIAHTQLSSSQNIFQHLSFKDILLIPKTVGAYFKIILFPFYTGPYFSMREFDNNSLEFYFLFILALAISVLIIVKRKNFEFSFFALLFLIFLFSVINPKILPSYHPIDHRFVYIPAVLMGAFFVDLILLMKNKKLRLIGITCMTIGAVIFTIQIFLFQPFFKNNNQYNSRMMNYFPDDYWNEPQTLFLHAQHLAENGEYKKAIGILDHSLQVTKNNRWLKEDKSILLFKANLLIITGDYEKGQSIVENILVSAVEKDLKYYGYLILSKMYEKKGDYKKAIHLIKKGEELAATSDLYFRLSVLYLKTMDFQKSLEYLENARKINPNLKNYSKLKKVILREQIRFQKSKKGNLHNN